MSTTAAFASDRRRLSRLTDDARLFLAVAAAYYIGAEIAFLIGTLSDQIFAPFWPPNVVLFCALLITERRRWWLCILAALPAHIVAELRIGMAAPQIAVAFVTNCVVAVANAHVVLKHLRGPPWFDTLTKASLYVLITGLIVPFVCAFGGAFVQITGGGSMSDYPLFWTQWYASNALGSLTLGSVALLWLGERPTSPALGTRSLEAIFIALSLILVCAVAFELSTAPAAGVFVPTLLYLPLPLILWSALRRGVRGACEAVLIVTVVLIWRTLNGPGLFATPDAETNVFALQLFLLSLSAPMLLLGAAIDETHLAARAARESEARMSFAAASANIGLWEYCLTAGRFWATDHCRALFGLPRHVTLTRDVLLQAVHSEDRAAATDAMRTAVHPGKATEHEFRIALPDGGVRWIHAHGHVHHDSHGTPKRISGVFTDVTARKASETEAELQRAELAHLTRVSVMGELSGALAHELNQPLTAILLNAQAVRLMLRQAEPDMDEVRQAIDDIVEEDTRAGEVISRLRRLLTKGPPKTETLDLNDVVRSALRLLRSEMINRRVRVNLLLADELPTIHGDAVQLQQVFLNLMMNAIEAMGQTADALRTITIATQLIDRHVVRLSVTDRGHGIAPEHHGAVLQPFFTTKTHGLGLGLSICSTIVRSHMGELAVANNANLGATATVTLPAQAANAGEAR
jgi:PAS domain S-box-containing protein